MNIRICYDVVQIELFLQWASHTYSMILVTKYMCVPINNCLSIWMYLVRKNIDYVWHAYCKNSKIWMKVDKTKLLIDIFDHRILLKRIYCMKSCMHCLKSTIRICYGVVQIELFLQWASHTWSMILVTSDIHILRRFNRHVDTCWKNTKIWMKINKMRILSDILTTGYY